MVYLELKKTNFGRQLLGFQEVLYKIKIIEYNCVYFNIKIVLFLAIYLT